MVGEFAAKQNIEFLLAVGPNADAYCAGAIAAGMDHNKVAVALDAEEATAGLSARMHEGDAILVKGSHFMGLEKLVLAVTGKDAS